MKQFIKLLLQLIDVRRKEKRLKKINKAANKYDRLRERLNAQAFRVNVLIAQYKEIYGEDVRKDG